MDIRIRKHNDMPKMVVVELIVDGKILDDQVADHNGPDVLQTIQDMLAANSPLTIEYAEPLDRRYDYNYGRQSHEEINIVELI